MDDGSGDASDAEALGPGASVADLSAVDSGAMIDDFGNVPGTESGYVLDLPLSGQVTCRLCADSGAQRCFLQEGDFKIHMETDHPRQVVKWRCTPCLRVFPRLHGWRCHFPKCKGRQQPLVAGGFVCQACGNSFGTKRGLSVHENHRHPELRNEKRKEANAGNGERSRPRVTLRSVWSEEEVRLLKELNERFKHLPQPNVAIRELLPGKTAKQISDKRRQLFAREVLAADSTDSSSGSIYESATEDSPRSVAENGSWKAAFRGAIIARPLDDEHELRGIEEEIEEAARDGFTPSAEVGLILERFIERLQTGTSAAPSTGRRGRDGVNDRAPGRVRNARTRKKAYEYSRYQELYKRNPRKLLDLAIMGKTVMEREAISLPSKDAVDSAYQGLWGAVGPQVKLKVSDQASQERLDVGEVWSPVSVEELVEKFKKIKSNTAAGVDGIRKVHLRKSGALHVLAKYFNLLMLNLAYPEQWKVNRTTLIPKPGKDLADINNWRPITIGSLLGRLYSAMVDRRIRQRIRQHVRQKGFTSEDGCKNNIAVLSSALGVMKEKSGGVITVIDISKAFDTVPHSALGDSLAAKGVPELICGYIEGTYKGCRTKISCGNNETVELSLRRGVKQGDPMSPLLFNLVIDPIIGLVDETTEGVKVGDENVSILAFADDLVLLAKSQKEAQEQAKKVCKCLGELGMSVSVNKCLTFQVVSKNKTWFLQDPKIDMGGFAVPYTSPESLFRYLGATIGPWRGTSCTTAEEIVSAVECVGRMGLKPHQKINLIRIHLLPRFIHRLVASSPSLGVLDQIDRGVKRVVKSILHLHPSTTDGLIYTDKSHGGLGIQRVANIVKIAKLRSALKMLASSDEAVRAACVNNEKIYKKYAASVGLGWPVTLEEVETARVVLRKADTERWRNQGSQGQGVREFFGDKIGNAWLYDPSLLKPSRYLDALKLRTNTFGTRVVLKRVNKDIDPICRRCGVQIETLGHVLGNCTHSKRKRIHRYDEICRLIRQKLPRHVAVFAEPTVDVVGDLRKPDMVIKDHEKVYVVDVTVRYEDRENLRCAYQEKLRKYKDTAELIRLKLNCAEAEVLPVVVGCRGAMPGRTIKSLKALGLSKKDMLTASLISLRSSIEIANEFLDYDRTVQA